MTRLRARTHRLAASAAKVAADGTLPFTHADGRQLLLPLRPALDTFLAITPELPFSLEAVRFLATCDPEQCESDLEAGMISLARRQVAGPPTPRPERRSGTDAHSGARSASEAGLRLPSGQSEGES